MPSYNITQFFLFIFRQFLLISNGGTHRCLSRMTSKHRNKLWVNNLHKNVRKQTVLTRVRTRDLEAVRLKFYHSAKQPPTQWSKQIYLSCNFKIKLYILRRLLQQFHQRTKVCQCFLNIPKYVYHTTFDC